MRFSTFPVLLFLLLLGMLTACSDTPRANSDDGVVAIAPSSTPESAIPTTTSVSSTTPTPQPLADVIRGNVFEPGGGDGGYLYDMQREVVAVSLEDVLWHPDNQDFFTRHKVRLLETVDGQQLVYRLIYPYAEAQIGWYTPAMSSEFEYHMVERNDE